MQIFATIICHSSTRQRGDGAQQHLNGLLKAVGSLGRLKLLAAQLAEMPGLQGELWIDEKALIVLCADHGFWQEGVTVSPKAVIAIQAANMVQANTGVCVLAACRIEPQVKPYLIPSHLSAERGAPIAVAALGLEPYLSMEMRLGEGSGAGHAAGGRRLCDLQPDRHAGGQQYCVAGWRFAYWANILMHAM